MRAPALTILHLSDLQFGRHHLFEVEGVEGDAAYDTLYRRLEQDLIGLRDSHGLVPDVIVFTGDLAEWGKRKEFEQFARLAEQLQQLYELERRRVLLVPGNHDVSWNLCRAYFEVCAAEDEAPAEPYWDKWKAFHTMFARFYAEVDDYEFYEGQPWTLFEIPELELVVAGLNSTMKDSHREADHYGHVGEAQLRWFERELARREGWLRVAAIHHDVAGNSSLENNNLRDAAGMRRILAPHLNLILHGHQHKESLEWWGPSLPILAAGSASVTREWREEGVPNQYQFVRVERERLSWWTRAYQPDQKRFVGSCRGGRDPNTWAYDEEVRFVGVDRALPPPAAAPPQVSGVFAYPPEGEGGPAHRDALIDRMEPLIRARAEGEVVHIASFRAAGAGSGIGGASPAFLRVTVRRHDGVVFQDPVAIIEGDLERAAIDGFEQRVVAPYRASGTLTRPLMIYSGKVAHAELAHADGKGIAVMSVAQYQGLVDLRPVVAAMVERLSHDPTYPEALYVRQRLALDLGPEAELREDALAELLELLRRPTGVLALVLGSFGAGKTFLMRQLARALGRAYLEAEPSSRRPLVPLLIEMAALDRSHGLDDLIGQALLRAGVEDFNLPLLRHTIARGQVVLLFDGFDELALRVGYQRASDHLDTILDAAVGQAKLVVTSRTQHFLTDRQATTALYERAASSRSLHALRLLPFDAARIHSFLHNKLGTEAAARARYVSLGRVHDLMSLSSNPRLLNLIAELDDASLEPAQASRAKLTSADIYQRLFEQWLAAEDLRSNPAGSERGLDLDACWAALQELALLAWAKSAAGISLDELTEGVRRTLTQLRRTGLDLDESAHTVGARTLLVRDAQGRFRFVHESVMEWLVARDLGARIEADARPAPAYLRRNILSGEMIDFLSDLVARERLVTWARGLVGGGEEVSGLVRSNAIAVLERLGEAANSRLVFSGQDMRGFLLTPEMGGAQLRGAVLARMQLDDFDLREADLREADLRGASLHRARLGGADLRGATLDDASLLGADLRGARLEGCSLRRAALIGAQLEPGVLGGLDTFGAAQPGRALEPALELLDRGDGTAIRVSPDGRLVAIASYSGAVVLRALEDGRVLAVLRGHQGPVRAVAWSPGGAALASTGSDGEVRVWKVGAGRAVAVLRSTTGSLRSVAWSPDGTELVTGGSDGSVRIWDIDDGQHLELRGHVGNVRAVAWLAKVGVVSAGSDGFVHLWGYAGADPSPRVLGGHTDKIRAMAVLEPEHLATASEDGSVRVWNLRAGTAVRLLAGHSGWVWGVAWAPGGERLASAGADGTVRVWEVAPGIERSVLRGHRGVVRDVAWSREGDRLLSLGEDGNVRVWDPVNPAAGAEQQVWSGHAGGMWSVAWSSDGKGLASAGEDGAVRIWDPMRARGPEVLRGHEDWVRSVAWGPSGTRLASASSDGSVRIWDMLMQQPAALRVERAFARDLAWSPDGQLLASSGYDESVLVWRVEGEPDGRLRGFSQVRGLVGTGGWVLGLAWSPDGAFLAGALADRVVCVWPAAGEALQTGEDKLVLRGHDEGVWGVAWSPQGGPQRLASAAADGSVRVWSLDDAAAIHVLRGHQGWVRGVDWSPDGALLASTGDDGTVRLWDARDGRELARIPARGGPLTKVAFDPSGRYLAACGFEGTVELIETNRQAHLASLFSTPRGWAIITPDGRYATGGDVRGAIWQRVGLCCFELGELDPYLPTSRRLPEDWRLDDG